MEILWWLLPPVIAGVLAMAWVAWSSRPDRDRIDSEEALARVGAALDREPPAFWGLDHEAEPAPRVRSTGVARRRA